MGAPLLLLLYVISLLSALPAGAGAGAVDLASEREALLALRAAIGRSALPKWNASTSPCSWPRVTCNKSGRVTKLRLPGVRLIGQIPPGILGNLTALQLLSLRHNAISGPLPSDLASCTELRSLNLKDNRFSGDIPDSLFQLRNLLRLDLARNQFSGGIPAGFNNLTRLATLYLESNRLSGELPDLNLPALALFNVSNNALNGSIPARLGAMPAGAFLNTSLCGTPLAPCPVEATPSPAGDKSSNLSGGAIAGIAVGAAVVFLILTMILAVVLCRRMRASSAELSAAKRPEAETKLPTPGAAVGHGKGLVFLESGPRGFDLEQLLRASAEVMGQGTFGMSYKTVLDNGMVLAVKRLKNVAAQETEFRETMEVIGAMRHSNLMSLKAYFYSRDEKLLVYDYMSTGSLSALLHVSGSKAPSRTPLNWEARAAIALSVARALTYIHSTSPTASHGNIKSSNVLLSRSYGDIRICDHGLAQLAASSPIPNRANGYRAPEVTDVRKVSQKADVFSFGVLLLELLTGKSPQHAILDEGIDLPRWVQSVVREQRAIELFELELLRYSGVDEETMMMMLQLAQDCTANYPDQRPSMLEVVARVEEIHGSSAEGDRQQQSDDCNDDSTSPSTHL